MILLDASIKAGIDALRYAASLDKSVQIILQRAQREILSQFALIDPFGIKAQSYQTQRMIKLNKIISAILDDNYKDMKKLVNGSLIDLADEDVKGLLQGYNNLIGASVFSSIKSVRSLKAIVSSTLIDGAVIGDWWDTQKNKATDSFKREIAQAQVALQTGLTRSETVDQLVRRIRGTAVSPGIMKIAKSDARALVRTSVMQVHNDANMMFMQDNADVIKAYQWLATLDNRTTPICRALDKKLYTLDFKPINHDIKYPGIPAHWQCRSILVPITKTYDEIFAQTPKVRQGQLKEIDPQTRAAMGRPVPYDMDYNSWLKTQTSRTQIDVLGRARYELWKDGKLSMTDMVDQTGRPLTIKELKERRKAARSE